MNANDDTIKIKKIAHTDNTHIQTSLYSLIEAVREAASPVDEELVPSVVASLVNSRKIKLYCENNHCSSLTN